MLTKDDVRDAILEADAELKEREARLALEMMQRQHESYTKAMCTFHEREKECRSRGEDTVRYLMNLDGFKGIWYRFRYRNYVFSTTEETSDA